MLKNIENIIASHKANKFGVKKHSSVLIPLILHNDSWHLLFEKRALTLNSQPGEICFPGGLVEKDECPKEAAIRETCEELNLKEDHIRVIGQIDSVMTSFDMLIHCYVGVLEIAYEDIHYSISEVDDLIMVPLDYLLNVQPETYKISSKFDLDIDFPFEAIPNGRNYNFKNTQYPIVFYNYDSITIWGLTARMVFNLTNLINGKN